MRPGRLAWLWLLPLFLLTTWLGAHGLNADTIWWDEYWSIYNSGGAHYGPFSPAEIWARAASDPWQPPGYYLLLAGWGALVGWTAFAVRALSLLAGVLTVAWTYRLGSDLGGRKVGLCAALAIGVSAFFIAYLHELRPYALYALFAAISAATYWRVVRGHASPGEQAAFALSTAGLLYTHYFASLVALAIALYHLLLVRKTRAWWRVAALMGIAGLLFLPWLRVLLNALNGVAAGGRQTTAMDVGQTLAMLAYGFANGVAPLLAVIAVGVALAVIRERGARLVCFLALVVLAAALILNAFLPVISHVRYLLTLWPLLAVVFAFGASRIAECKPGRYVTGSVLAVWIAMGIWNSLTPEFNDYLFREIHLVFFRPHLPMNVMADVVADRGQQGDAVVFDSPRDSWAFAGPFDYYMRPLPVRYTMADWLPGDAHDYGEQAQRFVADSTRVWMGVEQNMTPDFRLAAFNEVLADQYVLCEQTLDYPNLRLDLYALAPACCGPQNTPPLIQYVNGLQLAYVEFEKTDDTLSILTAWAVPPDVPPNTYSVGLHVDNAEGEFVTQSDRGLPVVAYSCQRAEIGLADLPPRDYRLLVVVYNWATGERLAGEATATGETADRFAMGTFSIVATPTLAGLPHRLRRR